MKAETFIKSGKRLIKRWLPRSSRLLSAHQLQRRQARAVSGFPPYGATYKAAGFTIEAGTVTTIPVTVTNRGTLTWEANSTFRLACHWYQGSTLVMLRVGGLPSRPRFPPTGASRSKPLSRPRPPQAPTH